jgi:hypothetical protein
MVISTMDKLYCRKLVLDALHYSSLKESNTSFAFNDSAMRIFTFDISILPIIEEIIASVVVPEMENYTTAVGSGITREPYRDGTPFLGLSEVFGVYYNIAGASNAGRVVNFLKNLPSSVVCEALSAMSIFFRTWCPIITFPLPFEYRTFLDKLTLHTGSREAFIATEVKERLGV